MRIVGGEFGGRALLGPASSATRSTTDKVREAIFNSLNSIVDIEGARVCDLFAGTGAWGIEAISRGAEHATFIDKNARALAVARKNVDNFQLRDRSTLQVGDALNLINKNSTFDVVFADPPYDFRNWNAVFENCNASVLICESDKQFQPNDYQQRWLLVKEKRYGTTLVAYFEPLTNVQQEQTKEH